MMKQFYNLFLLFVIIIISCQMSQSFGNSSFGNSIIETQVGPFNLSGPPFTESKLISHFGEGYLQLEKIGNKILRKKRIFWVPKQGVWVQIDFSHVLDENLESAVEAVLVTKKKLCDQDKKYIPQKTLGLLATSKGIKINDSIDKVIEKYGKPSISMTVGKDKIFTVLGEEFKLKEGLVLRYLQKEPITELNFAEFYFKHKKLHSLLISESE